MTQSHDEAAIRKAIHDVVTAIRAKDVETVIRHYDPTIVSFDLAPPLKVVGVDREGLEAWFKTWDGPIDYEVDDLHVAVSGDLAFAHSFIRIAGKKVDGGRSSVWARSTICLRKSGGRWLTVHVHNSVPFYMDGSVRAAVDLQP